MVYNDFHFLKPITANAWLKSVGVPQGINDFLAFVCALNGEYSS